MLALALLTVAVAEPSPRFVPTADFAVKAGEYMAARVAHRGFSGAVLVAHDGKPLFAAAYGLANRDHAVPNTLATRFRIGSISKQFTAACILVLEQQGKLNIDDPLAKHLPDAPKEWAGVTLRHLLNHTSGVPADHLNTATLSGKASRSMTAADVLGLVKDRKLEFKPGEQWKYSNTGYFLLGMVVARVSGQPLADFLHDAVLKPAGMTETGVEITGRMLPNRATGYMADTVEGFYYHMSVIGGAGAMYSTAGDLLKWDRALAGDVPLGPKAKAAFFKPAKQGYAAGIVVGRLFGRPQQWHNGRLPGHVAMFSRFPADGLCVIVLGNVDDGRVELTADALAAIAFDKQYVVPKPAAATKPTQEALDRLAGKYVVVGRTLTVARSGTGLTVKEGSRSALTYTAVAGDRFSHASRTAENEIAFTLRDGKPAAVTVTGTGAAKRWVRAD